MRWPQEILAGLTTACASLPICLATGLLLFGALGPEHSAGITASLYGLVAGGTCAALIGRSSFITSSPRASLALVQASLLASGSAAVLLQVGPSAVMAALTLCVLLAGLWQLVFGVMGMARIIKFTPHPVLAGFINGIALLLIVSQLRSFLDRPLIAAFVVVLAAFIVWWSGWSKRIPGGIAGLVAGVLVFHAASSLAALDLGPLLGPISLPLPPVAPIAALLDEDVRRALLAALAPLVLTALALAVVGTLESLLMHRAAQNLDPNAVSSPRDLFAQGLGNCASALAGGMAITASPTQSMAGYRAGGRTRLVPLTAIGVITALVLAAPAAFSVIPVAVLSAVLVATGVLLFDRWSLRLLREALRQPSVARRRRAWSDLAVVAVVMVLTAAVSVVAGIIAGSLLAGLTFIINMSRPVVRKVRSCEGLASKRVRTAADAALLRRSGGRRKVLELEGVLFFGNADELSQRARALFGDCDSIVLDLRGISDIDASGANILENLVHTSAGAGRRLLFCNVPAPHKELVEALAAAGSGTAVFADLDAALESMEENVLQAQGAGRSAGEALDLWQHPMLEGIEGADRDALARRLVHRRFAPGATLCAEGEPAQVMWLLTRGSVSVRVRTSGASLRVASCATGTAIGEVGWLQEATRSATVVADEEVEAYELSRESFAWLEDTRPEAATKLLRNIAIELARRLRDRTEDLRLAAD